MPKNKKPKITLDKLAKMIKDSFDNVPTNAQFNELHKDVKEMKILLSETIKRTDKLETKMDYVENALDIPQIKS